MDDGYNFIRVEITFRYKENEVIPNTLLKVIKDNRVLDTPGKYIFG